MHHNISKVVTIIYKAVVFKHFILTLYNPGIFSRWMCLNHTLIMGLLNDLLNICSLQSCCFLKYYCWHQNMHYHTSLPMYLKIKLVTASSNIYIILDMMIKYVHCLIKHSCSFLTYLSLNMQVALGSVNQCLHHVRAG